jgi:hypothetical protein
MNRVRLVGISSVAIVVLVAGACGSAVQPGTGSSTPTTSPAKKLDLAAAGTAATRSADSAGSAMFPVRPTTYVLDAPLPDLGPSALVRRMTAHPVNATDVKRFADALGIAGTPTRTPAGWQLHGTNEVLTFVVTDDRVAVSYGSAIPNAIGGSTGSATSTGGGSGVATPGTVVANRATTPEPPGSLAAPPPPPSPVPSPTPTVVPVVPRPLPPVDVPNASDAQTIARGLLDRVGVLAGQDWSPKVNDSGGIAVACPVGALCAPIAPEVYARTVTFSLMLNGTPADGVDWSVTLGEHRRIESLNGEWATPTPIGSYALRSTAAVFADLQHGTARYAGPQPMMAFAGTRAAGAPTIATSPTMPTVTVHVTGVSFGVARWDAYDHGHTVADLVPTYRFHARINGGTSYDIEVLALDPRAATFTNPIPTPKPLPAQPAPAPLPTPGNAVSPPSS